MVRTHCSVDANDRKLCVCLAYQFGLSLCDLAVILLQDFFQLLPLRFFFFLNKQHDDMLAHEQATKGTHARAHSHTHDKFVQPLTHF